jgi:hypothetical protein
MLLALEFLLTPQVVVEVGLDLQRGSNLVADLS